MVFPPITFISSLSRSVEPLWKSYHPRGGTTITINLFEQFGSWYRQISHQKVSSYLAWRQILAHTKNVSQGTIFWTIMLRIHQPLKICEKYKVVKILEVFGH